MGGAAAHAWIRLGHLDNDAYANAVADCNRYAAMMRRVVAVLIMTVLIPACVPTPKPPPQVVLGGTTVYLPMVQANGYTWQRTGYGRPWQSIGKDPELHGRGMWSYTWGMGNCTRDIPMIYSDQQLPPADAIARCAAASPVLLVFNEPEYASQANMTPEVAAKTLRYLESAWPGELWCCGNLIANHAWFDRMMAAYKAEYDDLPKLAGVHVHVYVGGGLPDVSDPDDGRWLARSQVNYRAYLGVMRRWGVPARVVVSECCLLGKYNEGVYLAVQDAYMRWLRSEPAVESVAWFSARYAGFPEADLLQAGGGLTGVGEAWLAWRWR